MANYAMIGYGKMGKVIEGLAKDKIVSIIDPKVKKEGIFHNEINEDSMKNVDIVIDFTAPTVLVSNVEKVASFGKNIVVGTTGWYDQLDKVKEIVDKNNIGFIYSPNFSMGMNIFFKLTRDTAKMLNNFDYDPFVLDFHHVHKADSSGTGGKLGNILLDEFPNKKKINREERKRENDEIDVKGIRAGNVPGTHIVGFDSNADVIELKHTAKSREGFAMGALKAAEWVNGKKGFFTIDNMMNDILK